jgi:hypothetical protein
LENKNFVDNVVIFGAIFPCGVCAYAVILKSERQDLSLFLKNKVALKTLKILFNGRKNLIIKGGGVISESELSGNKVL